MPAQDIILHLNAQLAVVITYQRETILPKADTFACLSKARNDIPPGPGALWPIPGPQAYSSGDVFLALQPNDRPVMLWKQWNATVRALQWFGEVYEPLAMVFSVMVDSSGTVGSGSLMLAPVP